MAAGLAAIVASMSRGKKAYLQYETQLSQALARLGPLREELKTAIDADAESYNAVMSTYKNARGSSDQQAADAMIDAALKQATAVPLSVAEKAAEVGNIAKSLELITNPNMKSDLVTALALARAALTGAMANVEINISSIKDQSFTDKVRKRSESFAV
jgi:glutamate formiminotransferase/formiminotetrahydrofolate cyclodeaminase